MTIVSGGFGQVLKALRRERGLSQADLADRLESTQRHISFLETGRTQPSRFMLQRIERSLALPVAKRLVLYEAAGFTSPYRRREEASAEVEAALDLIERQLLRHWPFPAYVLNKRWTVLRANTAGTTFLSAIAPDQPHPANLFEVFLDPDFRHRILNWEQTAPIFAARLFRAAADDPDLADLLDQATQAGLLAGLPEHLPDEIPIFVPMHFEGPDGSRLQMTSMLGQLASVQDAVIEGMTIELVVPMDTATEACLTATLAQAPEQAPKQAVALSAAE
ncbi:helix-turn-helix domain-containing protein [Roseibium sp.]|uniref:helix-turn-helix domain-containing protein n=1 Tax=Roseibium sp. TaxID=1936156 RepID=UPI003A97FA08